MPPLSFSFAEKTFLKRKGFMEQKRPAARVQQGFLHGAFILMFGVLLVKAIGALYKIPLSSIITEDGVGYFSTANSIFNVLPFLRRFSRGSGAADCGGGCLRTFS